MADEIYEFIFSTTNYDQFKFLEGNRDITTAKKNH